MATERPLALVRTREEREPHDESPWKSVLARGGRYVRLGEGPQIDACAGAALVAAMAPPASDNTSFPRAPMARLRSYKAGFGKIPVPGSIAFPRAPGARFWQPEPNLVDPGPRSGVGSVGGGEGGAAIAPPASDNTSFPRAPMARFRSYRAGFGKVPVPGPIGNR